MGRGDGGGGVGGREPGCTDGRKSALVTQLEDFRGREEQVGTVNSVTMYNTSGMTRSGGCWELAPGKREPS